MFDFSRIFKRIVARPAGLRSCDESNGAHRRDGSHQSITLTRYPNKTAGPACGVPEKIWIETNCRFVVLPHANGNCVFGLPSWCVDCGAQELADLSFGPPIVDPIFFSL